MMGMVVLTDWDWFQFLRAQPALDEANFWRPVSSARPSTPAGTPYLFKLNAKHGGMIVGYGIFAWHSYRPAWTVWEAFEHKNGAATFFALHSMLSAIRKGKKLESDPGGTYEIGCLMLSEPVFLDERDWVTPPRDWPKSGIMFGKSYDLASGEGARVWAELLARTPARTVGAPSSDLFSVHERPRFGQPTMTTPRLGQGAFRLAVSDAYGRACAVTGEHSLPVLEAAHIRPYTADGPHAISNGLLLRTDLHRLFDRGYVTVTPDEHRLLVSPRLRSEYKNGKTYYEMEGKLIRLPSDPALRPRPEYLEWHASSVFRA